MWQLHLRSIALATVAAVSLDACTAARKSGQGHLQFKLKAPRGKRYALSTASTLPSGLCYAFNVTGTRINYMDPPDATCGAEYGIGQLEGSYSLSELQAGQAEFLVKVGYKRFEMLGFVSPFADLRCGSVSLAEETDEEGETYLVPRMDGVKIESEPILFANGAAIVSVGDNAIELALQEKNPLIASWAYSYGVPFLGKDDPDASESCAGGSAAPESVTIAASDPYLAYAVTDPAAGSTNTTTMLGFTTDLATPLSTVDNPISDSLDLISTTSSLGSADVSGAPSAGTPLTFDATNSIATTITITADYPDAATAACEILAPFSGISCDPVAGISFDTSELASTDPGIGGLSIKAYSSEDPTDYTVSNTLPLTRFTVRKLSNTAGAIDYVNRLIEYDGDIYFRAIVTGLEDKLFRYNTLTDEVEQVSDIAGAGNPDYISGNMTVFGGRLLFTATTSVDLFSFDGSQIKKLSATSTGSDNCNIETEFMGNLHLVCGNGTTPPYKAFMLDSGFSDMERYSNTNSGGDTNDLPRAFFVANGTLFFSARNLSTNEKLYSFDGTNIEQISDINPAADDGIQSPTVASNGKVYFGAMSASNMKAYEFDPTLPAIVQISDTYSGNSDNPSYFTEAGGKMYFRSDVSGSNAYVFGWDGSTLTRISNTSGGGNDNPANFLEKDGILYFTALNSAGWRKLYSYDPSGGPVTQVFDINGSADDFQNSGVVTLTEYGNLIVFTADGSSGLYAYDTDADRLIKLSSTNLNSGSANPAVVYGGKLYFVGAEELWSLCDSTQGCEP